MGKDNAPPRHQKRTPGPLLKSTLWGGYDKLGVLEYIEQLLEKTEQDKRALREQLAAAQQLIHALDKENAELKKTIQFYQEHSAAADRKAEQLSDLILTAEKQKRRQLKKIEEEGSRLALEQSQTVSLQARRELQDLLSQFEGFLQNSAEDTYAIFEELTLSLEQLDRDDAVKDGD